MQPCKFAYSLAKKQPKSLGKLMKKAQQHIQAEEEMTLKRAEMGAVGMDREF